MAASHTPFEKLEKICAKNPTSILFARLADGFLRKGDLKRATEVCRQGLRYRPSYVAGHVVMGKCHLASGHLEEARQEFQKVLQLDADHLAALWQLGQIDLQMGFEEPALRHFELACALDPFNDALHAQIARLRDVGKAPSETVPEPCGFPEIEDLAEGGDDLESVPEPTPVSTDESCDAKSDDLSAIVESFDRPVVAEAGDTGVKKRADDAPPVDAVEPIATVTLAELYVGQGLIRQALMILERVMARDPENENVRARLEALRSADASQAKD